MVDPNEPDHWPDRFHATYRILPHGALSNANRWRTAQQLLRRPVCLVKNEKRGRLPAAFSAVSCDAESVALTAFYRDGATWLARLVELDGVGAPVSLASGASIETAAKANALGDPVDPVADLSSVDLRPHEIATIALRFVGADPSMAMSPTG